MPEEVDRISASRKRRSLPVLGSSSTTSSVSAAVLAACIVISLLGVVPLHTLFFDQSWLSRYDVEDSLRGTITLDSPDVSSPDTASNGKASLSTGDTKKRRLLDRPRKPNNTDLPVLEWQGIQIDRTRQGACGSRKCFFHSGANESEGYLMARAGSDWIGKMKRTFEDARRLNMRQFMLEPPHHAGVPPRKVLKELNSLATNPQAPQKTRSFFGNTKKAQYNLARNSKSKDRGIVVQKVAKAPTPNLIVRCCFFKGYRNGRYFLDIKSSPKDVFRSAVRDNISFIRAFQAETKDLLKLLAEEARLWYDFQFMVDYRGRIYHIDLDRMESSAFNFPSRKGAQNCLKDAMKGVSNIVIGAEVSNGTDIASAI